jgi:hypothetical protein
MISKFSAIAVLLLSLANPATAKAEEMTADQIFNKVEKNSSSASEEVQLVMIIQEPDGTTKNRDLLVKKQNGKEQRALVKLQSPADLKGVGLLTIKDSSSEDNQWLYLPSEKRSRRIIGSGKKKRFLDSELSYEDMRVSTYKGFKNKVIGKEDKITVIESIPEKGNETAYSKIKTWVNTKDYTVVKSEYYDDTKSLLKTMAFDRYKKHQNVWVAHLVKVKNVKKNRGTVLETKTYSAKKLSDGDFSMGALEEG